jgi:hypothetical protein
MTIVKCWSMYWPLNSTIFLTCSLPTWERERGSLFLAPHQLQLTILLRATKSENERERERERETESKRERKRERERERERECYKKKASTNTQICTFLGAKNPWNALFFKIGHKSSENCANQLFDNSSNKYVRGSLTWGLCQGFSLFD